MGPTLGLRITMMIVITENIKIGTVIVRGNEKRRERWEKLPRVAPVRFQFLIT